jgi:hypothetical protein
MRRHHAATSIAAPPEEIWRILTDGPAYPEWDASVDRIEGRIAPGETLRVYTKLNPGRTFPVKVTEFVPGSRMAWSGGMPLGLFKGVRTFTLDPRPDGTTAFALEEVFTGPLLPLIGRSIPDMSDAFQGFVDGLRARAEGAAARSAP